MVLVQLRQFVLATGSEIPNCQVDSNTKLTAEIQMMSEFGSAPEEIMMMEINIARSDTGQHVKCFRWTGDCALRAGVTYTIDTPIFTLPALPQGAYYALATAFSSIYLSKTLPECGINIVEVAC